MADFFHFSNEVGSIQNIGWSVAAGEYQFHLRTAGSKDLLRVLLGGQVIPAGHIVFIQDNYIVGAGNGTDGVINAFPYHIPIFFGRMTGRIHHQLVAPGLDFFFGKHAFLGNEIRFTQSNKGDAVKALEHFLLRVGQRFHELDDAYLFPRTYGADGKTDGSRGFPLAVTGIYLNVTFHHILLIRKYHLEGIFLSN